MDQIEEPKQLNSQKTTGGNLQDLGLGNGFLNMTLKAQDNRKNIKIGLYQN